MTTPIYFDSYQHRLPPLFTPCWQFFPAPPSILHLPPRCACCCFVSIPTLLSSSSRGAGCGLLWHCAGQLQVGLLWLMGNSCEQKIHPFYRCRRLLKGAGIWKNENIHGTSPKPRFIKTERPETFFAEKKGNPTYLAPKKNAWFKHRKKRKNKHVRQVRQLHWVNQLSVQRRFWKTAF